MFSHIAALFKMFQWLPFHSQPAFHDLVSFTPLTSPLMHPAPATQASVLFLKHAKHSSASDPWHFLWLHCHLFGEAFPDLPSPTLPAFLILSPDLLFSKVLITTSKTAHLFYLFVCCLHLPLDCKLHEGRGFCPFHSVLYSWHLEQGLVHCGCSVHAAEWMTDEQPNVGIVIREDIQPIGRWVVYFWEH